MDWFSLFKRDRPHASVSMTLEFFFRRDEFPAQLRDEEIAQFLERRITTPVEGTTIDNYVYGIACVLALSLPDPVLRVLRSKPDDRGSLSVLDAFLVHGYDSHHLSTVIFQFFNIYRTEPDGFDNPEDTLQAISDAVDQILADGIYRALYFAWQISKDRVEHHFRESQVDAPADMPSDGLGGLFSPPFLSGIAEEDAEAAASAFSPGYARSRWSLKAAQDDVEQAYAPLTFKDAIAARGSEGFLIGLCACVGALVLLINALTSGGLSLIANAHAQTATGAPSHEFTPPVGLPLSVWVPMVIGFYLFLLAVLVVFLYKGYLASPKSEKAAAFIDRFGTLALGVLPGKVTGF